MTPGIATAPRFTVAIPTYHRADRIGPTIESALDQDYPGEVEVLVVDNGDGTDGTPEAIARFGDRVRYHRNLENLGMWGNFAIAPELATGEYLAWLSDDDFFRRDFCRRAAAGLGMAPDVALYTCYAALTPSPRSVRKFSTVHGPMVAVDWLADRPTLVDGLAWPGLNYFESQAMPPAVACRRETAIAGCRWLVPGCVQFNEYILIAAIAATGRVAVDPWIGVMHIEHPAQAHTLVNRDREALRHQRSQHEEFCARFFPTLPTRWRDAFAGALAEIPVPSRLTVLNPPYDDPDAAITWAVKPAICRELRDMIVASLPEPEQSRVAGAFAGGRRRIVWLPRRLSGAIRAARWTWSQG